MWYFFAQIGRNPSESMGNFLRLIHMNVKFSIFSDYRGQ
jgi:hypothetical protein